MRVSASVQRVDRRIVSHPDGLLHKSPLLKCRKNTVNSRRRILFTLHIPARKLINLRRADRLRRTPQYLIYTFTLLCPLYPLRILRLTETGICRPAGRQLCELIHLHASVFFRKTQKRNSITIPATTPITYKSPRIFRFSFLSWLTRNNTSRPTPLPVSSPANAAPIPIIFSR